jgi:Prion-inhibition and propagation
MEAIGFAVSLTGLITIFDKACDIWRSISAARNFGDDVVGSIRKLEIEHFRFQSWWTAVQRLEALPVCSALLL